VNTVRRLWHRLRDRHAWMFQPKLGSGDRVYGPWLVCRPCNTALTLQSKPPLSHPDSMTVELPAAEEEWLAAVDEQLWPREAA
jgi:hypothetical protein